MVSNNSKIIKCTILMKKLFFNLIPPFFSICLISLIFDLVIILRNLYYHTHHDLSFFLPGKRFLIFFPIILLISFLLQFIILWIRRKGDKIISLVSVLISSIFLFFFMYSEGVALSSFITILYLLYLSIDLYIYRKLELQAGAH
jgi:hypothetical protein